MSDDYDEDLTCKCDDCGCQVVMSDLEAYFDKLLCDECLEIEVNGTAETSDENDG